MNPIIGWGLAAIGTAMAYYRYGWAGVALAVSVVVFWLLLQFSRALRAMTRAGKALPQGFLAFGEVGLAGEVRPAPRGQERLKEAAKLGFSVAMVPKANAPKRPIEGLTVHAVERIEQAIDVVRSL